LFYDLICDVGSMRITASIVAANPLKLGEEIERLEAAGVDGIHIDVADGHFVQDLGIGPHMVAAIRKATNLPLYVHLMVEEPERFIDCYLDSGADSIIVHIESCRHLLRTIRRIKHLGKKAGLAVLPATILDLLKDSIKELDQLLLISNNDSSFLDWQDREFYAGTLNKLREASDLKEKFNRKLEIMVDGGVRKGLIAEIVEAGADTLVMGSALFSEKNLKDAIHEFRRLGLPKTSEKF